MKFEAWWEEQPPDATYQPQDPEACVLACWLRSLGYAYVHVSRGGMRTEKGYRPFNQRLYDIAALNDAMGRPFTKQEVEKNMRKVLSA